MFTYTCSIAYTWLLITNNTALSLLRASVESDWHPIMNAPSPATVQARLPLPSCAPHAAPVSNPMHCQAADEMKLPLLKPYALVATYIAELTPYVITISSSRSSSCKNFIECWKKRLYVSTSG